MYPARCYRALAPSFLAAATAAHGVAAPSPAGRYRYCEIGCGTGLTLAVLATANPQASFLGVERDPAHAAAARALAGACRLANLHIVEADIADLADAPPGSFDYITLHGVYSWVAEPVRAHLRTFLHNGLAAGGIAHVSYNALPGWSGLLPVRDWLQRRVRELDGTLAERVLRARDQLLVLQAQAVPFFTDTPVAAAVVADLRDAEAGYIVHEYLLPGWDALYFAGVQPAMQAAGLEFVGEAELPGSLLPCSTHEACRTTAGDDPLRTQIERDFLHNRFFRRDLYGRMGAAGAPDGDPFDELLISALVSAERLGGDGSAPGLDPLVLAALRRVLGERVMSFAELRVTSPLNALSGQALRDTVLVLLGRAELSACTRHGPLLTDSATAHANNILLQRFGLVASPLTGSVLSLDEEARDSLYRDPDGPAVRLLERHGAIPATPVEPPPPPTGAPTS